MTIALSVTIAVIFLLSLTVVIFVFHKKEKIPCMTGMMIAMTLGMMVGLIAGVILGVILSANLFISTLISMAVGIVIGFIAGAPVSVMAVLDGMLAGLMGGMMGAMLGEMISSGYQDMIIKIMFVIFVCIVSILLFMMKQELMMRKKENGKDSLFHNPLFMLIFLGVFFFGYNQLGSTVTYSVNNEHKHEGHQMKQIDPSSESGGRNGSDLENSNKITIMAKEFLYSPNQIHIRKGEKVTIILQNQGDLEHELEIVNLEADITTPGDLQESHHSKRNTIHMHVSKGDKQSVTFIPKQPGLYKMVCTIPGHEGMKGWIKVT